MNLNTDGSEFKISSSAPKLPRECYDSDQNFSSDDDDDFDDDPMYKQSQPTRFSNSSTNLNQDQRNMNKCFTEMIKSFQYAPGLFGIRHIGEIKFVCMFCPLMKENFGEWYGVCKKKETICLRNKKKDSEFFFPHFKSLKSHANVRKDLPHQLLAQFLSQFADQNSKRIEIQKG